MITTQQILFIAKTSKSKQLQQLLTEYKRALMQDNYCSLCEVYGCDDDSKEFLFYVEFQSDMAVNALKKSDLNKKFEIDCKSVVAKKEILRLD